MLAIRIDTPTMKAPLAAHWKLTVALEGAGGGNCGTEEYKEEKRRRIKEEEEGGETGCGADLEREEKWQCNQPCHRWKFTQFMVKVDP